MAIVVLAIIAMLSSSGGGTVALSRNRRLVAGPDKLQVGDTVILVGQFTSVVVPPAPPHEGYSFIGVEATSIIQVTGVALRGPRPAREPGDAPTWGAQPPLR